MNNEPTNITVDGHLLITNGDTGEVILDKHNAIHPQNMARVIARALSNENNYFIHRIAFGNGGTTIDAALNITYKTPNDGQSPDPAGFESGLYNETYYEIIDDSNPNIGQGPGANPPSDPPSVEHTSGPGVRSEELGTSSKVVISVTLNPSEPTGQFVNDILGPLEDPDSNFTFDEIGLFTLGLPGQETSGIQNINVGNKKDTDLTGLNPSESYTFTISVDGGPNQVINITTPAVGSGPIGEITYQDLINTINSSSLIGATASITNGTSIETFGFLRFTSLTTGLGSSVLIQDPGVPYPLDFLFSNLAGFAGIEAPSNGTNAGVPNDPVNPGNERERLLTHIIFSPIAKTAARQFNITYTLTVTVARSV